MADNTTSFNAISELKKQLEQIDAQIQAELGISVNSVDATGFHKAVQRSNYDDTEKARLINLYNQRYKINKRITELNSMVNENETKERGTPTQYTNANEDKISTMQGADAQLWSAVQGLRNYAGTPDVVVQTGPNSFAINNSYIPRDIFGRAKDPNARAMINTILKYQSGGKRQKKIQQNAYKQTGAIKNDAFNTALAQEQAAGIRQQNVQNINNEALQYTEKMKQEYAKLLTYTAARDQNGIAAAKQSFEYWKGLLDNLVAKDPSLKFYMYYVFNQGIEAQSAGIVSEAIHIKQVEWLRANKDNFDKLAAKITFDQPTVEGMGKDDIHVNNANAKDMMKNVKVGGTK